MSGNERDNDECSCFGEEGEGARRPRRESENRKVRHEEGRVKGIMKGK